MSLSSNLQLLKEAQVFQRKPPSHACQQGGSTFSCRLFWNSHLRPETGVPLPAACFPALPADHAPHQSPATVCWAEVGGIYCCLYAHNSPLLSMFFQDHNESGGNLVPHFWTGTLGCISPTAWEGHAILISAEPPGSLLLP